MKDFVVVFTTIAADPVIFDRESKKSVARLYAQRFESKEEAKSVADEICEILERREHQKREGCEG